VRGAFIETLVKLAHQDERILLLTGDLGYTVIEPFADAFPDRFLNVGVAEQNLVGIATGLAEGGFIPFLYSIATFAALRPYEFIRNGPVLHHLPVRIVGVGGGFEYGSAGFTHHGLEDIGALRLQPTLTIVAPADAAQTRTALEKTWDAPGPIYFRLGKNDQYHCPQLKGEFDLHHLRLIGVGRQLTFLVMGGLLPEVMEAVSKLEAEGIGAGVAVVSSFNPGPVEDVVDLLRQTPMVITVEAHYVNGGLGTWVGELALDYGLQCRVLRCGIGQLSPGLSGSQRFLNDYYGLSSRRLVEIARSAIAP
jgi:transketolase